MVISIKRPTSLYVFFLVLLLLSVFYAGYSIFVANKFPKDDEVIKFFNKNRSDLEYLIKLYYAHPEPSVRDGSNLWDSSPAVKELKKKVGVRYVNPHGGYWPPDLYGQSGANLIDDLIKDQSPKGRFNLRQYEALNVIFLDERYGFYEKTKSLLYIPAVVDVSHGVLKSPFLSGRHELLKKKYGVRDDVILPDLTELPEGWEKGKCFYRVLDVHWFIEMCYGFL
ncbi:MULTISPECIES: hypothetical protein [Deefgea]|uniref:Uncharacterized protein n=1 Tax=Deefgea chitinilytica TaxID=570276 RepID=A0ABS2C7H4_9NEIS|nr:MULTISPECIES: hypothetical protein [Deefgea]MBM5570106.1 hypothetical protein [Deefgea chitinilytica]MBM9887335.1 hypothetical protein [Deefgea sp. CFH1-16]